MGANYSRGLANPPANPSRSLTEGVNTIPSVGSELCRIEDLQGWMEKLYSIACDIRNRVGYVPPPSDGRVEGTGAPQAISVLSRLNAIANNGQNFLARLERVLDEINRTL